MAGPQQAPLSWLEAVVLGIVEGLTEFLPVSSTGHLILVSELLGVHDATFEVAIQVGAITAIGFLYRNRLWEAARRLRPGARREPGTNLLVLLVAAAAPAAVVGLLLEESIDRYLFNSQTVVVALVLGGVLLILLEGWLRHEKRAGIELKEIEGMTVRHALVIGLFQCLALIPGTSRAGATIAGALLLGFSRPAAAEFAFLVGLPILYGACSLKIASEFEAVSGPLLPALVVAAAVSFVSAALIVRPFVSFLRKHTFLPFAWYRIALGALLGVLWMVGAIGLPA